MVVEVHPSPLGFCINNGGILMYTIIKKKGNFFGGLMILSKVSGKYS